MVVSIGFFLAAAPVALAQDPVITTQLQSATVVAGNLFGGHTDHAVRKGAKILYTVSITATPGSGELSHVIVHMPLLHDASLSTQESSPACTQGDDGVHCVIASVPPAHTEKLFVVVAYNGCYQDEPVGTATVAADGLAPAPVQSPPWSVRSIDCDSPLRAAAQELTIDRTVAVQKDLTFTVTLGNPSSQPLTVTVMHGDPLDVRANFVLNRTNSSPECTGQGSPEGTCVVILPPATSKTLTLQYALQGCARGMLFPPSVAIIQGTDVIVQTSPTIVDCTGSLTDGTASVIAASQVSSRPAAVPPPVRQMPAHPAAPRVSQSSGPLSVQPVLLLSVIGTLVFFVLVCLYVRKKLKRSST